MRHRGQHSSSAHVSKRSFRPKKSGPSCSRRPFLAAAMARRTAWRGARCERHVEVSVKRCASAICSDRHTPPPFATRVAAKRNACKPRHGDVAMHLHHPWFRSDSKGKLERRTVRIEGNLVRSIFPFEASDTRRDTCATKWCDECARADACDVTGAICGPGSCLGRRRKRRKGLTSRPRGR